MSVAYNITRPGLTCALTTLVHPCVIPITSTLFLFPPTFSDPAEVIVTQHPMDGLVHQGGRIQLYCKAECKPHGPLYQWFISQVGVGGVGQPLPLKGQINEQLIVQQAEITHHGKYCCRCTNPYMGEHEEGRVAFSNWAMVTVAGEYGSQLLHSFTCVHNISN